MVVHHEFHPLLCVYTCASHQQHVPTIELEFVAASPLLIILVRQLFTRLLLLPIHRLQNVAVFFKNTSQPAMHVFLSG
jgi:hypothetical protein